MFAAGCTYYYSHLIGTKIILKLQKTPMKNAEV